MLRIIGDDIELNSKVVARILIPRSTLRDTVETAIELADPDNVAEKDHLDMIEQERNAGYKDGVERCIMILQGMRDDAGKENAEFDLLDDAIERLEEIET